VNSWQQVINQKYSLTDPHDPSRKRASITPHDLPKQRKEAVIIINEMVLNTVELGLIKNRVDVIQQLNEWGFQIARETPSAISIKDPENGKNIRLKGAFYESNFDVSKESTERIERAERDYKKQRQQRYEEARTTLDETYKRKCDYNQERYKSATSGDNKDERTESRGDASRNIQSIASIHDGTDSRRKPSHARTVHHPEIKHPDIKKRIENNDRCKSRISTCIETVVNAVRTAVRRSISADSRTRRANNIANELANERFKEQKLKQQRGPDAERRSFRM
jgi:hypothetical protein